MGASGTKRVRRGILGGVASLGRDAHSVPRIAVRRRRSAAFGPTNGAFAPAAQPMEISGRQHPLAHTVPEAAQVGPSGPPGVQAVVPEGHWGVPPPLPPVPVDVLHSEPWQLPAPAQKSTQASPESPPPLF